jgi:hypothetical protein
MNRAGDFRFVWLPRRTWRPAADRDSTEEPGVGVSRDGLGGAGRLWARSFALSAVGRPRLAAVVEQCVERRGGVRDA